MKLCTAKNLTELREIFNSVDYVSGYTVFNIGGNNYRLITSIHYNRKKCYVRVVWTHTEYSRYENQDKLRRGQL
ncbi:type II toxin-antitoxin system HigB family toxin [Thiotrichales bacterium 19X7-9]|nr:type II toxin-antitoxin system HigB family toxin [Thiotrichales bacterium 19X7-9]